MSISPRAPSALWLVTLLVMLVAAAIWAWSALAAPAASPMERPRRDGAAIRQAGPRAEMPPPAAADAAAAPRELVTPAPAAPTSPAALRLRGRVLDSRGIAMAGVRLGWMRMADFQQTGAALCVAEAACAATSDALGAFELPPPEGDDRQLPVTGPGWTTLRSTGQPASGTDDELLVVAAAAKDVTGRTTRADDGTSLANVAILPSLVLLTDFPRALDHTTVPRVSPVVSDANGAFRLCVPLAAGVDVVFSRAGFAPRRVPCLEAAGGHLEVALSPVSGQPGRIHGRAHAAGAPAAGARVELGLEQQTSTDARGEFTFELPRRESRLVASLRGWMPVVREGVGADTPELDVHFERRALTITGAVRNADGSPLPGWRVDLVDGSRGADRRPIELDCRDGDQPGDCLALTDVAGRFVVGGLADRAYTLLAYDPKTLVTVQSPPIAAGSEDVVLTVPADALLGELRGIVVDRRGSPVAGAGVHAWLSAPSARAPLGGATTTTGDDGRFVLANAPRRGVRLGISKPGFVYAVQPIEDWLAAGHELRVELLRLCAARVEGPADLVVEFRDGTGNRLHAESHSESMAFSTNALTLRGGRSPVMMLPETTATMVWSRDQRPLGRKPVSLDTRPGAVTLLIAGT